MQFCVKSSFELKGKPTCITFIVLRRYTAIYGKLVIKTVTRSSLEEDSSSKIYLYYVNLVR